MIHLMIDTANNPQAIDLEPARGFHPVHDPRPIIPQPLPVRLVAVESVTLDALTGQEHLLDEFYVGLLQFARADAPGHLCYHADNFDLEFRLHERPFSRPTLRPLQIEVLSLAQTRLKLVEREIEFAWMRGMIPGEQFVYLLDPAGNALELIELRRIM